MRLRDSLAQQVDSSQADSSQPDSSQPDALQIDDKPSPLHVVGDRDAPLAHVVLYQPQIPQNTGNIGRTCVATASKLWIVQPAAFRIDEKRVRRAGLDYWQHLNWENVASWDAFKEQLPEKSPGRRYWYFSRFAERSIWDCDFQPGEVFVFGSETTGLPRTIFSPGNPNAIRLPTTAEVRSLNLSSTVAIVLYEMLRRKGV